VSTVRRDEVQVFTKRRTIFDLRERAHVQLSIDEDMYASKFPIDLTGVKDYETCSL